MIPLIVFPIWEVANIDFPVACSSPFHRRGSWKQIPGFPESESIGEFWKLQRILGNTEMTLQWGIFQVRINGEVGNRLQETSLNAAIL